MIRLPKSPVSEITTLNRFEAIQMLTELTIQAWADAHNNIKSRDKFYRSIVLDGCTPIHWLHNDVLASKLQKLTKRSFIVVDHQ